MGQPQGLPLQISGNRLGEDHAGRRPAHPGGLVPAYSHLEERWGNPVVTLFSFPILHSPFSIPIPIPILPMVPNLHFRWSVNRITF